MTRFLIPMCGAAIVCGSLVATTPARADDRSPEAILIRQDQQPPDDTRHPAESLPRLPDLIDRAVA